MMTAAGAHIAGASATDRASEPDALPPPRVCQLGGMDLGTRPLETSATAAGRCSREIAAIPAIDRVDVTLDRAPRHERADAA